MAITGNVLTPATMREGATTIRNAEDGIRTTVAQLDNIFEEIKANWRDSNGVTYANEYEKVREAIKKYLESCERLAKLQEAVLEAYQKNVYDPTKRAVTAQENA